MNKSVASKTFYEVLKQKGDIIATPELVDGGIYFIYCQSDDSINIGEFEEVDGTHLIFNNIIDDYGDYFGPSAIPAISIGFIRTATNDQILLLNMYKNR